MSTLLEQGEQVPVKIVPEPDNQYDSKAITFQCKLDTKLDTCTLLEKLSMMYTEHWSRRKLFSSNSHGPSIWWYGCALDLDITQASTYPLMENGLLKFVIVQAHTENQDPAVTLRNFFFLCL